jgi:hypothetical protein
MVARILVAATTASPSTRAATYACITGAGCATLT